MLWSISSPKSCELGIIAFNDAKYICVFIPTLLQELVLSVNILLNIK